MWSHNTVYGIGTYLAGPQNKQLKIDRFYSKLLRTYPNNANSSTTATSQVELFLSFQIQKDQLVPSYVHHCIAVQKL